MIALANPLNNASADQPFVTTAYIPFSEAASIGFGSKCVSIGNLSSLGSITITEISHEFTAGVTALLRRCQKKSRLPAPLPRSPVGVRGLLVDVGHQDEFLEFIDLQL